MQDLGSTKSNDGKTSYGAVQTSLGALLLTQGLAIGSNANLAIAVTQFEIPVECVPWLHAITGRCMPDRKGSLTGRLRQLATEFCSNELMTLAGYVNRIECGYEEFIAQAVKDSNGVVVLMRSAHL